MPRSVDFGSNPVRALPRRARAQVHTGFLAAAHHFENYHDPVLLMKLVDGSYQPVFFMARGVVCKSVTGDIEITLPILACRSGNFLRLGDPLAYVVPFFEFECLRNRQCLPVPGIN